MDIVKNVVRNEHIREAIRKSRENIKEGESIAHPLSQSKHFPPTVIQMIRVGEKSGNLENMLEQISESYDKQLETEVSSLTSLLEPLSPLYLKVYIDSPLDICRAPAGALQISLILLRNWCRLLMIVNHGDLIPT